jgi:hypothetical protein
MPHSPKLRAGLDHCFMAQQFQPKPINFVPPILRRKFIAPDNPRELGTLVMLIGFAVFVVSAWSNVNDVFTRMGKRSTTGEFVASAPFRSSNAQRMVGVYVFKDEANTTFGVRGDRVYTRRAKIPRKATVVWPNGRSQKARVVGEYYDYLLGLPIGAAIFGFGLWLRRKRVDPYEQAMKPKASDDDSLTS